jgi:outer membrane immunogenic protein
MKNLTLTIAVACVAVIGSINQTFAQKSKTRYGIKAGIDLMTLGSATANAVSINYQSRVGFQGGFYAEESLSDNVSFSSSLLYTQKGGDFATTISGVNFKGSTQVNYLDIPLLFAFKLQSNISFYAGPQVSFLLSQRTTATGTMSGVTASDTSTSTDGLRKTIFGANLGVGYKISNNVGVNLNYIFDLQHAAESGSNDTGEKNSGFGLTVGYLF